MNDSTEKASEGDASSKALSAHAGDVGVGDGVLPEAFRAWLRENQVNEEVYRSAHLERRFIRVSVHDSSISLEQLEAAYGKPCTPVDWCAGFYQIPTCARVAASSLYKEGRVYGTRISFCHIVVSMSRCDGNCKEG
eukprot:m.256400 g.256400  ORF g.256400 m.256400 type:complete len:136 (+) comp15519_c0_seq7:75-482(+)